MAAGGRAGGEEGQLGEFLEYMDRLRNYERSGVPRGAGTDSDDGFDLGRMRRLLRRLGDPHTHYPVRLAQPSPRLPLAPTHCCLLAGEDPAILLVKNVMAVAHWDVLVR
jgi:hypothetical protein